MAEKKLFFTRQGAGEPLVILHGLFGSSKNWQSLARQFAEHADVICVDLRNHGQSFHADAMNYEVMAQDVAGLLQDLQLDHCNLLGHSMGGKVAIKLALDLPAYVDRLIVADIAPVSYSHHHDPLIEPILAIDLAALSSRAEADQQLSLSVDDAQLRAFLLQNLQRESTGWCWRVNWKAIQRQMSMLTGFPEISGNSKIDIPALFIRGGESAYIDANAISVIERHFSHAEVCTIEGAGHWLHAEQPDRFAQLVIDFLFQL